MDPRLQLRVQRYGWDRAASTYDEAWSAQLSPARSLLFEMADLREGESVLDVACGSGLVTLEAARRIGGDARILGTDLSDGMLDQARRAAANADLDHVEFLRSDAESLGVPEAGFDAALCALGLMYAPDPVAALREMRRAVKPGGRVVAAVWGERRKCGWAGIFPIVDARVNTEVCPLFFQLGTGDSLQSAMETAGLEDVQLRRITSTLEYATDEEALAAAFAGGPVAMAYSRFGENTRLEAHAEYLDSIQPFRRPQGYRIPGEFVVARGRAAPNTVRSPSSTAF